MADDASRVPGLSFPNESSDYRRARNALLEAEIALRRQVEAVAAQRRALPLGGEAGEDYVFEGEEGPARLSELFGDKPSLVVYSYMYGPNMERPCPSCTSMLDGLDGQAPHISQRSALAVVAKSPLPRILDFARARGWRNLRLLSSAQNSYSRDYKGEDAEGGQWPILNVFTRRDGKVFHAWSSELAFAGRDPGQDPRHIDLIWPLWNVLDTTPEGRGAGWRPSLEY
jgi:predicted dithiol-disulfide oxidoreductase (DUF899 family)